MVLGEVRLPNLKGLVIALDAIGLGTLKVGGVPRLERLNHSYMREGSRPYTLVSSSHAKSNSSLLEVVAERPVAEHLKEGVVVDVLADIVQIIVLASSTNALLRVASSLQLGKRTGGVDLGVRGDCECNLSQEDGLVLIHSGIRKKKRRIVEGNNGGGFDKGVSVVLKELDKGATHLGRRPGKFGHESV